MTQWRARRELESPTQVSSRLEIRQVTHARARLDALEWVLANEDRTGHLLKPRADDYSMAKATPKTSFWCSRCLTNLCPPTRVARRAFFAIARVWQYPSSISTIAPSTCIVRRPSVLMLI